MKILIVEDDSVQASNLQELLTNFGHQTVFFVDPIKGFQTFESNVYDLVFLDMRMPGLDGVSFLKRAVEKKTDTKIVILTAYGTIETAVEAMKNGAFDFLEKPVDVEKLKQVIKLVQDVTKLSRMADLSAPTAGNEENLIIAGPAMQKVQNLIGRVAALTTTVLIQGETGTGKELVARAIHGNSPRKNKPFIAVNCANLQGNLLESELFGHEKGAFTGAESRKLGKFELASGGTLFLDEVGEIPIELQSKLLRAIQEGEIERLGGTKPVRIDVRIVSATNRDLVKMVEKGIFRRDLYYRLNVFPLILPPLRERREEIPALARKILSELSSSMGNQEPEVSSEALEWLKRQLWPGNIRELRNILERASIIDEDGKISPEDLIYEDTLSYFSDNDASMDFPTLMVENEKSALCRALEKNQGNVVATARDLGLPRRTLYDKLKKYGIDPSRFRKME
ncbi:MAG: sigma-54-dependent Fis family transcriptional regulator [Candidatus Riflebacteria bacterium]|nr:sigma-54-dependent Fis family transcriptional regulator [Candidatus Riflebacteria bacterium]